MSAPTPRFDWQPRTRVVFGPGMAGEVGHLLAGLGAPGASRVLLVSDPGVVRAGHLDTVHVALVAAGAKVRVFDQVAPNPSTVEVSACVEVARAHRPELVVAVGGGSAIDTAKAATLLWAAGGRLQDYVGRRVTEAVLPPIVVLPTTAGTGSETQSSALIADAETHLKMACLDPQLAPRLAVLDPRLTLSQPPEVTGASGLDVLTHAVETRVSRARTAASELWSREAFRLAEASLERVLGAPEDVEARGRMMLASAWAGLAIEQSMLGAAHAAGNPLTRRCGLAHGFAVGVMLPEVVRQNAGEEAARAGYAELAWLGGLARPGAPHEAASIALAERLDRLVEVAGAAEALRAVAPERGAVAALSDEAAAQWTGGFNPRTMASRDYERLYLSVLNRHVGSRA